VCSPGTPLTPHPPLSPLSLSAQGTYIDKKCPFTGNVAIRGRILKGIVVSTKMNRTIVLRRDYLRYITKYRRYEKRHKTLSAHCSPAFLVKDGDVVTVGQCRCVPCGGERDVQRGQTDAAHPTPPLRQIPLPSLTLLPLLLPRSPLSKTVRFNVLKVESATEAGAMRAKKTFRVF
jgi:ribosomal protein S17